MDGPSKNDPTVLSARTDGGKLVHFTGDASLAGEFKYVHIDRADAYAMYGTVKEREETV